MKKKIFFWSEKNTEKLKQLYPGMPNKELAKQMRIPERTIRSKALKLGLRKKIHFWSLEEDAVLLKNKGKVSAKELLILVNNAGGNNRTLFALYDRLKVLEGRRIRQVLPEALLLKKTKQMHKKK